VTATAVRTMATVLVRTSAGSVAGAADVLAVTCDSATTIGAVPGTGANAGSVIDAAEYFCSGELVTAIAVGATAFALGPCRCRIYVWCSSCP